MAEAAQKVMEKRLKILRESRTGKKGSITKRINQLYQYVAEKEGRRATELLLKYLHKVYEELEKVCGEISELSDEYDGLNDLEDAHTGQATRFVGFSKSTSLTHAWSCC